jgi:DNA-binding transcriptional MerR regulator
MSKLTGVHIKSLRYYERIGILKPAYVNPSSGYRYYFYTQAYIVEIIKFAIEMDIPLKEVSAFFENESEIHLQELLKHTKKVSKKKIKSIQKSLKFIDFLEESIKLQEKYPIGTIYKRNFPKHFLYTIPYTDISEAEDLILELPSEWLEKENTIPEYGYLNEYKNGQILRYIFIEVPEKIANYIINAGEFSCIQTKGLCIEESKSIFGKEDNFIITSSETFTSDININKIVHELRLHL